MDTEKQKSSPGGTVPGEKVPPVLTAEDVAALEELCGDVSGYFYKMLDYLDQRVRDGVRQGEFTEEQARGDLDLALWYAYACNNIDDYDYYYKAAQWMPASEPAAEAAGSGIWYYRYACALMYWAVPENCFCRFTISFMAGSWSIIWSRLTGCLQRSNHSGRSSPSTVAAFLTWLVFMTRWSGCLPLVWTGRTVGT